MKSQLRLMVVLSCGMASLAMAGPAASLQGVVNDSDRVVLYGNVHPLARPEFDAGCTDGSLPEERMILALAMRPDKKAALERLLVEQQDPGSPNFHQWLTPEEFGDRFGATPDEISLLTGWLQSHGFVIDEVGKGRTWINFTGTVAEVDAAFHTEIHDYVVAGDVHHANTSDPSIPRALADIVAGVVSLHDFRSEPASHLSHPATDMSNGAHWLSPADFATIYDVNPLYNAGINGAGQSIAVVARSNLKLTDVQFFRSSFNLPSNDPQFIINGTDPGIVSDESEAVLDVEWSGAVAPNATIKVVISKSTTATDGTVLSAQYIINNNASPVLTMSYYLCESSLGVSWNQFYNNTWAQAAAQGISVFVCSGDSGAAGCDADTSTTATGGLAVSGLCSSPYSVCVGGTQFMDTSNPNQYWSATNNPTTLESALSYIPEQAWNESGAAANCPADVTCQQLWSTGGGASAVYPKPAWQVAPGVPNDGARDVPDVALASASHNAYMIIIEHTPGSTGFNASCGTSAATPSLAGLMALIVQGTGQRQGNPNPQLYQLGNAQYSGTGPAVFHDVTVGNNSVPGQTGFSCGTGYDLATGLGSVDATALAVNWCAYSINPTSQPFSSTGGSATVAVTVTSAGNCGWAATSNASWLHVTSGVSGIGNGTVGYAVDANSGSARSGTLTIAGQTFTVNQGAAGSGGNTVTIFSDGFEGSFPGQWSIYDYSGVGTQWGRSTAVYEAGTASAWCAGGGTYPQPPDGYYVNGMNTWMVFGPFSLADATAAQADFDTWYSTETYNTTTGKGDRFWWTISIDGTHYWGYPHWGYSGGWVHKTLNFSDVTTIAAVGASQVWFAFSFDSDASVVDYGAYVDNFVLTKTVATQTCSYSLNPTSQSFSAAGGGGSVAVTAGSGCGWTAAAQVSWISVTAGASGSGNGSVSYVVQANSGSARSGTVTIAGQIFTVYQAAQACSYSLGPQSASLSALGGTGSVGVTVTSGSNCSWYAASNESWLHVTSGASGTGNGTVGYAVDANSGSARSGTLTIAGQTFTVNQSGGGIGTVTTILSDNFEGSFPGQWQLLFSSKSGTDTNISWGKSTYRTTGSTASIWCAGGGSEAQPPGGSYYPDEGTFATYGPFSLAGATSASLDFDLWLNCERNNDYILWSISADGHQFYGYSESGNTGGWTHETLNFADVTEIAALGAPQVWVGLIFVSNSNVEYEGAYVDNVVITKTTPAASCSFSLSSGSQSFASGGGTGSVGVMVTSGSNCSWTATSNASWLHVTSGASGTGNGTVGYAVDANSGSARSGTLAIAGQTFTVTQDPLVCTYTLDSSIASFTSLGGSASVVVAAPAGCPWTASTDVNWIHIASGSGTGSGTFSYSIDPNLGSTRSGTITVQTQIITVNQDQGSVPVSDAWLVTTVAGTAGRRGSVDGVGPNAGFDFVTISRSPFLFHYSGVALDAQGNLFVVDSQSSLIRIVRPDASVSTLAGEPYSQGSSDGVGSAARFTYPSGIAVNSRGIVFVADCWNHTIRRITQGGEVSTFAGSAGVYGSSDGLGTAARFDHPSGLAFDRADYLYVADRYNNAIRRISPAGQVTTVVADVSLQYPSSVAVDSAGNILVADTWNNAIRRIGPGGAVTTLPGTFSFPSGVAVDAANNVYVSDSHDSTIVRIGPGGDVATLAGSDQGSSDGVGSSAEFTYPSGIAVTPDGIVFVVDTWNFTLRRVVDIGPNPSAHSIRRRLRRTAG